MAEFLKKKKQIGSGIDGKDSGFRFPKIPKYCVILGHSNNVCESNDFFFGILSPHVHMIILKTVILTEEYQLHLILPPAK